VNFRTDLNFFILQDLLEIRSEQLPPELVNFEISRCREVRLLPGSLTQQKALRKIHTYDIETLILKKNSFLNASATNSLLHVSKCHLKRVKINKNNFSLTDRKLLDCGD